MANKQLEAVSALLDDELQEQELSSCLEQIDNDDKMTESFSRYSLIGDVMRNEQQLMTDSSLADAVQNAIADIELPQQEQEPAVVSIASHPSWMQRAKNFAQTTTGKMGAQFAIAASVALVAVVGVNNLSLEQDANSSPVINTNPLINGVAPVSLNSQSTANKPTANQMTHNRINALIADHNQQLKVSGETEEEKQEEKSNDQP